MRDLKTILTSYVPSRGGTLGPRKLDREQLRKDLLTVSEKNKSFFYIGIGMLIVLFIAALTLVWFWRERPELITAVFGASGVSITGIIATMFSHWKEKTRIDMLLVLLGGVDDEESLKMVIATLAAKL